MCTFNAVLNGLPQVLMCIQIKAGYFCNCLYAQMKLPLHLVHCPDGIKLYSLFNRTNSTYDPNQDSAIQFWSQSKCVRSAGICLQAGKPPGRQNALTLCPVMSCQCMQIYLNGISTRFVLCPSALGHWGPDLGLLALNSLNKLHRIFLI